MYTKAAPWATIATPFTMRGVEGSSLVLYPNMVAGFRDKRRYRLDFSHDMPARMEEASRKLLESCFGGFFLRSDRLG